MSRDNLKSRPAMGTMEWGRERGGALSRGEKLRLVGNLGYLQVREAIDGLRQGVGLLHPSTIELDHLMPPETSLVQDALRLAEETQEEALLFHSWRTYLFGVLFAAHEQVRVDRSLLFAAAILHDTGLTSGHTPQVEEQCFALSGGVRVDSYLREKGHPGEVARRVGDAIAIHLNAWVLVRRYGAEAHLVSRGAVCDLFGAGRRRLPHESLAQILRRIPRAGVTEGLRFETAVHSAGSRPDVMTRLSGGKAPADKFRDVLAPESESPNGG